MRHFRFTIAGLLGLVLFLAVGIAALREATDLWDSAVFSATLGVLSVSVLLAVHRADSKRAYWLGFALCGWVYLGASLIPPIEARLLTTKALAQLDSQVPGRGGTTPFTFTFSGNPQNTPQTIAFSPDGRILPAPSPMKIRLWNTAAGKLLGGSGGTTENFVRIGHSIIALIMACLGGQLSRRLCAM